MWLLDNSIAQAIAGARGSDYKASIAELADFKAITDSFDVGDDMPRIMAVSGEHATINIQGVLTDAPDFFSMIFGGGNTTYREIIRAVAVIEQNDNIKNVDFIYKSPGGSASADWLDAMNAIATMKTATKSIGGDMTASAAYGLAVQSDTIVAQNEMSKFGSIGVMLQVETPEDVVTITSDGAENKHLDATTPQGVAIVKETLNAIHAVFVSSVAKGRGVDEATVRENFGKGGILLTKDAINAGMIDSNTSESTVSNKETSTPAQAEAITGVNMTLDEFKAAHPGLHSQIVADATKAGAAGERERCSAFLTYGKSANMMDAATKHVVDGSDLTATHIATFTMGAINANSVNAIVDETQTVVEEDPQAAGEGVQFSATEKLHDDTMQAMGLKVEGAE